MHTAATNTPNATLSNTLPTNPMPMPTRSGALQRGIAAVKVGVRGLDALAPVVNLAIRLFVATVFFKAGLTKIASWETTVALFENEYMVPLLAPALAAFMATCAELALPVLLVLGLGTRFAAAGLFVLNIVAVLSYPGIGEVGLGHHQMWGLFLLVPLTYGAGLLSLDHLIGRRWFGGQDR